MIFTPKAVFFDWDHTLWDHDANARESLGELFVEFELNQKSAFDFDTFFEKYQVVNHQLWEDYQFGKIDQATLRETRFKRVFDAIQVSGPHIEFGDAFLHRTPRKTKLMDGATEIVTSLAAKYPLYILTNGFSDVQEIKISGSGLKHYFEQIITSEEAQSKKPDPQFYYFALQQAGCQPEEALMIGDHEKIDIWGAEQVGIPAIHLYEKGVSSSAKRIIERLEDLKNWIVL
jgi:putative hydrolase of the HAD superfamily